MHLGTVAIAALAALLLTQTTAYTNPIEIKNYRLFDRKTKEPFVVRGVDYYPRPNAGKLNENSIDFFTDDHENVWSQDVEKMAELGANAVRIYAVDPSKKHDKFMCALRAHGMYALVELGATCKDCSITKANPPDCYPNELRQRGEHIIAEFAQYDNLLAFSGGNEVNHVVDDSADNAPCQKKFIRDMRKFLGSCSTLRQVPVGVVIADTDRKENALYYNCRTNPDDEFEEVEWFGINTYVYCNADVTDESKADGFDKLISDFDSYKYSIPVLLTEFGCLNKGFPTEDGYAAQRTWLQAEWMLEGEALDVFGGGFAFEYSTEKANAEDESPYPFKSFGAQNYGLGYFSPEDCDHDDTPCKYNKMPNFDNLAKKYNGTDISKLPSKDDFTAEKGRTKPSQCPDGFAKLSKFDWESDSKDSSMCPDSPAEFTCPNQKSSGDWTSTASEESAVNDENEGSGNGDNDSDSVDTKGGYILAASIIVMFSVLV